MWMLRTMSRAGSGRWQVKTIVRLGARGDEEQKLCCGRRVPELEQYAGSDAELAVQVDLKPVWFVTALVMGLHMAVVAWYQLPSVLADDSLQVENGAKR